MTYNMAVFDRSYSLFRRKFMCKCAVKKEEKSKVMTVKNSWRLRALFRIEKYIRELGQESRAKRMGICGNTIFV